jgi:ribose transport system ATP-binding protein
MEKNKVLIMEGICKVFSGVEALQNVDFYVNKQEIVGLVGENGAGKSTLMRILVGLYSKDKGKIMIYGKKSKITNPKIAIRNGIGMVFQEGSLISNLTIAENIFLCHEHEFKFKFFLPKEKMLKECKKLLVKVGLKISPDTLISNLSRASQQMVEIARLLWLSNISRVDNPILIFDEPTSVLLSDEINQLFEILRNLKKEASIIFISHRLKEVIELSDRIVILKNGRNVGNFNVKDIKQKQLEQLMVGHEIALDHYLENNQLIPVNDETLSIKNMEKKGKFFPTSFSIKKGEILGLVGTLGSGKEEICKCIMGIAKKDNGQLKINGKEININSPNNAINFGIGYVPADRRNEGLALQLNVLSNITLIIFQRLTNKVGIINLYKEKKIALNWIKDLSIKTPSLDTVCSTLSGGNQQKIVLSKWLAANIKILILNHPTRGIDVGAKQEIYKKIRSLAKEGMAIILISDTLEENIGLSNRIIVFKDGTKIIEIPCEKGYKPKPSDIIEYMV